MAAVLNLMDYMALFKGCYEIKPQCGKCNQKMVDVPAKFAEMITEQFNVQCSFAEKGCSESVAFKVSRACTKVSRSEFYVKFQKPHFLKPFLKTHFLFCRSEFFK